MSLILLGILNSQVSGAAAAGDYDLLETTILTSSASSFTFTGLDSYTDYKHLQMRIVTKTSSGYNAQVFVNGDTGANYAGHQLYGNASSAYTSSQSSSNSPSIRTSPDNWHPNIYDFVDFSNSNKYKTIRGLEGVGGGNGQTGSIWFRSLLWMNTNAITSFEISADFITGSRFSLYGVK